MTLTSFKKTVKCIFLLIGKCMWIQPLRNSRGQGNLVTLAKGHFTVSAFSNNFFSGTIALHRILDTVLRRNRQVYFLLRLTAHFTPIQTFSATADCLLIYLTMTAFKYWQKPSMQQLPLKKMNYADLTFTDLTAIWFATNMLVEWEILLSLNSLTSVFSICSGIPVPIFSDL